MIKAIIFDFDGVILNTFEMSFQSMKYALNNLAPEAGIASP